MVFLNIEIYTYNTASKELIKPDVIDLNVEQVISIRPFERPYTNKDKYFVLVTSNKEYMIINDKARKEIIKK